jgi:hypothetical protein
MKSYPCETPSRQPPLSYQPEDFYGGQLFWHVIAIVLLAAITALAGLSLIGPAPRLTSRLPRALTDQNSQSQPQHWQKTKYDGRHKKWISTA